MFKWFGGSSPPSGGSAAPSGPHEVVTDDPLAIISLSLPRVRRLRPNSRHAKTRRPKHIYAVSRVNPIFEDEEGAGSSSSSSGGSGGGPPASPGQSGVGSSGYESHAAGERSSSEFSDDAGSPVGGGRRPPPGAARRRSEQVYLAALAALASIPEGQVPVPVWPAAEATSAVVGRAAQHAVESPPPPPPAWRQQLWERLTESSDDDSRKSCCDLPPTAPMPPAQTQPPPPPARCASSTSSSGYSDSSIIVPPPPAYLQKPDLQVTNQEMALVRGSVRNAMIYGTLKRIKCTSGLGVYERLAGFWRTQQLEARLLSSSSSSSNDKTDGSTSSKASWQSLPASPTPSNKTIHEHFEKTGNYHPPSQRPDFTLDVPTAERVMRKIAAAKRRRCWCQLSVSILGLIFFIMSVMAVSMMYTRGERMFGSL